MRQIAVAFGAYTSTVCKIRDAMAIIDNNAPGRFELEPRDQFIRLWAGYGGVALTVLSDPPRSIPYPSYQVIE